MSVGKDVNFEELASRTDGASGADIKAMCTEAGMFAIREDRTKIKMLDFTKAIDKVMIVEADNIGEGSKMFA
jgi:proteasome regulatory subunit